MNTNLCFVTLATGGYYIKYQSRLLESIKKYHPDAGILSWTDTYPAGSKTHHASAYGFKCHAIKEAIRQGYHRIIWLDAPHFIAGDLNGLQQIMDDHGIFTVPDANRLHRWISKKVATHFGYTIEQLKLMDARLSGGSPIAINLHRPGMQPLFDQWCEAEQLGLFADASKDHPEMETHRHDEAVLAILMIKNGIQYANLTDKYAMYSPKADGLMYDRY